LINNLIEQERMFLELLDIIMKEAENRGVTLRVLGAVAFRVHCPKFKHIEYKVNRGLSDLDFAAYRKDADKISDLFMALGYRENLVVRVYSGGTRRIFNNEKNGIHSDVFFDELHMCHDINLKGRLEIDYPTISLVDLLLEKLQIVDLDGKDIIDTVMLLREHNIGNCDNETINVKYLATLCARDWGLWRTVTMNLNKIREFLPKLVVLGEEDRKDVETKIKGILETIDSEPKSPAWKLRAKIGDKKKWYRDVDARNH